MAQLGQKPAQITQEEVEMFHKEFGIRIDKVLGHGVYGYVYQATFVDVDMMIKRPVVKEVEVHPSTSSASASGGQPDWISEHKTMNGQKVAVKWLVYKDQLAADKVKIESRILDVMQHPNIVTILTAMWLQWDKLAIIMELSPIGDVNSYLHEVGQTYPTMTYQQYRKFAQGVVSGLVSMHKIGYCHRDLHQGNILIFPDPDDYEYEQGQVIGKLCDFGQAYHLKLTRENGERIENPERMRIINEMDKGVESDKRKMEGILGQVVTRAVRQIHQREARKVHSDALKALDYELRDLDYYKQEVKKQGVPKTKAVPEGEAETGL